LLARGLGGVCQPRAARRAGALNRLGMTAVCAVARDVAQNCG